MLNDYSKAIADYTTAFGIEANFERPVEDVAAVLVKRASAFRASGQPIAAGMGSPGNLSQATLQSSFGQEIARATGNLSSRWLSIRSFLLPTHSTKAG